MKRHKLPHLLAITTLCSFLGADTASSIREIRSVDAEGRGNESAAEAWSKITKGDANTIPVLLAAMDDANVLAANWLRSAVDTIAQRNTKSLPIAELEEFLSNRNHNPKARRLAYELIARSKPALAKKLIKNMLNDPSVELRREAVQGILDRAQKEDSTNLYETALNAARDIDQIDEAKNALTEAGIKVDLPLHFGFLMHWKVVGPFDNTGRKGFATIYPPENEINFAKSYTGKKGTVKWSNLKTADTYGMVDINEPYGHLKEVVAYAHHTFESNDARKAEIRLGCKNAWKIWLNGSLVFERDEYHRGMRIDQYTLPIEIQKGKNQLLIKLCQNEQKESWTDQWQFQLRICDSSGTAILAKNRLPTPQPKAPTRRPKRG
ncbi:MAG: hypothetical protein HOK49_12345 [Opitutae bacterium]|nr:hypothetical protein [Opitutae bacterium]MBT5377566.1 hypothetical protein [Opitutae bacterium]MBT6463317.1 hypothetical protein [Opitutae bacterium]